MSGSMLQKKYIGPLSQLASGARWFITTILHNSGVTSVRNQKRSTASTSTADTCNGKRGLRGLAKNGLALALLAASGAALAQTTSQTGLPAPVEDGGLTWKGITLYGIIDAAVQYETHGAPFNDYFISGGSDVVQKNSNNSVLGVTSNGLSQSRVGLQGSEPMHFLDFSGVFKLETFFNPASGNLTNALKSVAQNNGRALDEQSTNIDSSIAGQIFEQSFVGISSPTYGTLTFGRQNTTLADLVAKYDPQQVSYAFSLIGLSGTPAGGGDTQDRRLDDSIKYGAKFFDIVHLGLQYKFQNSSAENYATAGSGEAFTAAQVSLGAEYAGASVDAFYTKVRDAVSIGALSATQVTGLPALGYALDNSLSGTISDNAAFGAMASYAFGPATFFGAYEHITYMNPSIKLAPGFDDIGGYTLAYVSNTAYAKADKILQVYWAGARYTVNENLTAAIAYYGEKQNAYATGADAGCSSVVSGASAAATSTRFPFRSTITSPSASTPMRAPCGRTFRTASPTAISKPR
jgi:predicted porin